MKRKILTLSLALLAVFSLTVPVFADAIWAPNDSFYEKHWDECDYWSRCYELAGHGGTVTVFTAPGGMNKATLDNGARGTVQFTWKGEGTSWGYLCWVTDSDVEGWVPMDDMTLVYDSREFFADHAGEITEAGQMEVDFHEAVCYSYPNGPAWDSIIQEDADYMPFSQVFTQIYTDENGLRWGFVGYYMGSWDAWVCLDDPMNEELDTAVVPCAPSAAQLRGGATVTAGPPAMVLAGGLVAGVAAVTGVLLLKRKKK